MAGKRLRAQVVGIVDEAIVAAGEDQLFAVVLVGAVLGRVNPCLGWLIGSRGLVDCIVMDIDVLDDVRPVPGRIGRAVLLLETDGAAIGAGNQGIARNLDLAACRGRAARGVQQNLWLVFPSVNKHPAVVFDNIVFDHRIIADLVRDAAPRIVFDVVVGVGGADVVRIGPQPRADIVVRIIVGDLQVRGRPELGAAGLPPGIEIMPIVVVGDFVGVDDDAHRAIIGGGAVRIDADLRVMVDVVADDLHLVAEVEAGAPVVGQLVVLDDPTGAGIAVHRRVGEEAVLSLGVVVDDLEVLDDDILGSAGKGVLGGVLPVEYGSVRADELVVVLGHHRLLHIGAGSETEGGAGGMAVDGVLNIGAGAEADARAALPLNRAVG